MVETFTENGGRYLLKINLRKIREKIKAPRKNGLKTWNMAHGR